MKTYKWIIIVFILTAGSILVFGSNLKKMKYLSEKNDSGVTKVAKYLEVKPEAGLPKDHDKMSINCKTCHYCEYPTISDPCLITCPRNEMVSVHHSAEEGPEIVEMDNIKGDYGVVVFSHKLHAQMSEMSGGCESCHHYNTTGPVLKCVTCHETSRIREDLSKPDLEAAYHRQCLTCHRQWSRETNCQSCHINQNSPEVAKVKERIMSSKHPPVQKPQKVVYETGYEKGKIVTFYHGDHSARFNIKCISCHQDENCIKCHDYDLKKLRSKDMDVQRKKVHKSFDEHHAACVQCHKKDDCGKCHRTKEMNEFDHFASTGFDLNPRHNKVKCNTCHKEEGRYKGLSKNCNTCHLQFAEGKFDHKKIGIEFDDIHADLECIDCHKKNNFSMAPKCNDCHDDKYYPASSPGKRISITKPIEAKKK